MEIKVDIRTHISHEEWKYVAEWSDTVFPVEGKGMEWSPVQRHALALLEDVDHTEACVVDALPIAHLGFGKFPLVVNKRLVFTIGIGALVVRPEYQKNHIPSRLFDVVHEQAKSLLNCQLFSLFCPNDLVVYYQRHGYRLFKGDVRYPQFGKLVPSSFAFMYRGPLQEGAWIELSDPPW